MLPKTVFPMVVPAALMAEAAAAAIHNILAVMAEAAAAAAAATAPIHNILRVNIYKNF